MRCMERNKTPFYYSLYLRTEPTYDEYGNENGSKAVYDVPVAFKANISPARGESSTRQFGDTENYDKVIVLDDVDCSIDASTVLWVDSLDTTKPHDYIVKKVAKSLNSVSIAISKVNVS